MAFEMNSFGPDKLDSMFEAESGRKAPTVSMMLKTDSCLTKGLSRGHTWGRRIQLCQLYITVLYVFNNDAACLNMQVHYAALIQNHQNDSGLRASKIPTQIPKGADML